MSVLGFINVASAWAEVIKRLVELHKNICMDMLNAQHHKFCMEQLVGKESTDLYIADPDFKAKVISAQEDNCIWATTLLAEEVFTAY